MIGKQMIRAGMRLAELELRAKEKANKAVYKAKKFVEKVKQNSKAKKVHLVAGNAAKPSILICDACGHEQQVNITIDIDGKRFSAIEDQRTEPATTATGSSSSPEPLSTNFSKPSSATTPTGSEEHHKQQADQTVSDVQPEDSKQIGVQEVERCCQSSPLIAHRVPPASHLLQPALHDRVLPEVGCIKPAQLATLASDQQLGIARPQSGNGDHSVQDEHPRESLRVVRLGKRRAVEPRPLLSLAGVHRACFVTGTAESLAGMGLSDAIAQISSGKKAASESSTIGFDSQDDLQPEQEQDHEHSPVRMFMHRSARDASSLESLSEQTLPPGVKRFGIDFIDEDDVVESIEHADKVFHAESQLQIPDPKSKVDATVLHPDNQTPFALWVLEQQGKPVVDPWQHSVPEPLRTAESSQKRDIIRIPNQPPFRRADLRKSSIVLVKGAQGCVKVMRHAHTQKLYVVKGITVRTNDFYPGTQDHAEAFILSERLGRHPNIVELKDLKWVGKTPGLRMRELYYEYCSGGDLARFMNDMKVEDKTIPAAFIAHILSGICAAVAYLHLSVRKVFDPARDRWIWQEDTKRSGPILHRDIKPDNVLLKWPGSNNIGFPQIVLTDFGLACEPGMNTDWAGTPGYWSPEIEVLRQTPLIKGKKPDGRHTGTTASDIYSIGATIFSLMIAGELPSYQEAVKFDKLPGRMASIKTTEGEDKIYPEQLLGCVAMMLSHDPAKRPRPEGLKHISDLSAGAARQWHAREPVPWLTTQQIAAQDSTPLPSYSSVDATEEESDDAALEGNDVTQIELVMPSPNQVKPCDADVEKPRDEPSGRFFAAREDPVAIAQAHNPLYLPGLGMDYLRRPPKRLPP